MSRLRIILVCTLLAAVELGAQQHQGVWVGAHGAAEVGVATGTIAVFAASPLCGQFDGGTAAGSSFGADLLLPDFFSHDLGLHGRLAWANGVETFTTTPLDLQPVYDRQSGEPVYLDRRYQFQATHDQLRLDVLGTYQATPWLLLKGGPSIGARVNVAFSQTDRLLGPGNRRFADGTSERPFTQGIAISPQRLAAGAVVSGAGWLQLRDGLLLLPELTARVELLSPGREAAWQRFTVGAGITILYDMTPDDFASSPAEPPPLPEPPPPPSLDVAIDLYSIGPDGERSDSSAIEVQDVLHRTYTPFLPVIFFEQGATQPSTRYVTHPLKSLPDSISRDDALSINHHTLGIIAQRMAADPASTVTIIGSRAGNEPLSLARYRAETVKGLLRDHFMIRAERMTMAPHHDGLPLSNEATEQGRNENRRVELTSQHPALLAPVVSERLSREFNPPTVGMAPMIDADAGVRRWTITIRHGEREVKRYSSDDTEPDGSDIAWDLVAERMDTSTVPLVAELIVEDSTGTVATAQDEIPLVLVRSRQAIQGEKNLAEREISLRHVGGFGYGSAEPDGRLRDEITAIAATVRSGAMVTVTGYTDELGEKNFNRELARLRAATTAALLEKTLRALGIQDVMIRSLRGESDPVTFDGTFPEGRMLLRGVTISVGQEAAPSPSAP